MESEREAARRAIKRRNWLAHLWREWIVESRRPIAPVFAHPTPDTWSDENLTASWIGHSTVRMKFVGVNFLTDDDVVPILATLVVGRVCRLRRAISASGMGLACTTHESC